MPVTQWDGRPPWDGRPERFRPPPGAVLLAPVIISLLVQVPASKLTNTGLLNGYRIGSYPARPLNGNPLYLPPRGFVEVTDQNEDERLSPSFRLGQFNFRLRQAGHKQRQNTRLLGFSFKGWR